MTANPHTPQGAPIELPKLTCTECGMLCDAREFHPFAACLMFKGCRDSEKVRSNLDFVRSLAIEAGLRARAAQGEPVAPATAADEPEGWTRSAIYQAAKTCAAQALDMRANSSCEVWQRHAENLNAIIDAIDAASTAPAAGSEPSKGDGHDVIRLWNERARAFGFDGVAGILNAMRHGELTRAAPAANKGEPT